MDTLKSLAAFHALRDRILANVNPHVPVIVISAGTCGQASGANALIRAAKREILSSELDSEVRLRVTGCHGFCEMEPSVLVEPTRAFYPKVAPKDMARIVRAAVSRKVIEELLPVDVRTGRTVRKQDDLVFFGNQTRSILSHNERVDPIRVYTYIQDRGYEAFAKALEANDRERVLREIKESGLRGRGGAGFPTGTKWELLARQPGARGKVLVCNADEGDPGAYMDRSVLEGNPHSILEGMLIGAFATGADEGVIYVRNEYPLAIKHLVIALRQARELGLLGANILGTGFRFDIQLVRGAGAFVCGEETALIASIEGRMGEPRQRPPFPVQEGIDRKPTAINNVETWANVPRILLDGAAEYARTGTPGNTGTKIFSLVGKIRNTGLVEVPMGTTIGELVFGAGGGPVDGGRIKAVQTGGPSGGCIPAHMFDLPIDYDSLSRAGSIMGSGGMIVMDQDTCMVDVAKYFMNFLKDESCGKCFTCRKGTQRMWELLDDITSGRGTPEHLDLLHDLALVVRDTSMCGLGQSAPNPVLSTLRYFRDEYMRHIVDKRCDAFVCKDLVGAPCQSACPIGTEAWRYVAHLARGEYEDAYLAIREANPFPSVCARVCDHPCESRCRLGATGARPVAIRALKRFVTDRVEPSTYKPQRRRWRDGAPPRVAIVGSGPAGLTAAHYLSLEGCAVTVFEADSRPGGMLVSGIPAYRLRRDTLEKEIEALLDENITLKCDAALGRDFSVDDLLHQGYRSVFLALGAHKSRRLNIAGEDVTGVWPAIQFLKRFNLGHERLATGNVGVIGGGNSAVDAARVALRQEGVRSVTIFYRRTRHEMPALKEEIAEAIHEGVRLETLVAPVEIRSEDGRLTGVQCRRTELRDFDKSGRRSAVPIPGTEFLVPLDFLIVTIGDEPDIDYMKSMGIETTDRGTLRIDPETMATNRPGVFAGGDVVTGPNTVVEAIAAGKRAAAMMTRHLRGEPLRRTPEPIRPGVHVEPAAVPEGAESADRAEAPTAPLQLRRHSFVEVEMSLKEEDARREACRCLRCDLEFTAPATEPEPALAATVPGNGGPS